MVYSNIIRYYIKQRTGAHFLHCNIVDTLYSLMWYMPFSDSSNEFKVRKLLRDCMYLCIHKFI